MEGLQRRDKINYYLDLAEAVSQRGTCLRKLYGADLVSGKKQDTGGFFIQTANGTDAGFFPFAAEIFGNLIGQAVLVVDSRWVGYHAGWLIDCENILILIQNL